MSVQPPSPQPKSIQLPSPQVMSCRPSPILRLIIQNLSIRQPVCPSIGPSIGHILSYSIQSCSSLLLSSHFFLCILISRLISSCLSRSTSHPSTHAHCLHQYASSWSHPSHHMTQHIPYSPVASSRTQQRITFPPSMQIPRCTPTDWMHAQT